MTLRARMVAAAGVAVAVTAVALAAAEYEATRSTLRSQIDSALTDRARPFATPPRKPRPPADGEPERDLGPKVPFGGAAGSVQFVHPNGKVVLPADESSSLPVDARTKALAKNGSGRFFSDRHVGGIHLRVLTVGIGSRGAVQVARPLTEVDHALHDLLVVVMFVGGGGILLAAVLGGLVAQTALAPVSRFTKRTESLTANPDLSQRLELVGRDELTRLARSFNATLDALERSVEAQRHLVADASHELRTPIASLRANIQILEDAERLPEEERDALRADIITELDELTALVADIVELARGTKATDAADDVRLDQIVDDLVERSVRRSGGTIEFRTSLEPTLVSGEPDRISRAVSNLLDNAAKWSPPGSVVDVELRNGTLTVRDRGPGFDEEDLPHVFDRFYRAESARRMSGSGLGLAIVRQAAEAHGGSVAAANAHDGGAVVGVRFSQPSISGAALARGGHERYATEKPAPSGDSALGTAPPTV